jgi:large subunit ribosomal protein L10
MSRHVKDLVSRDIAQRLRGVGDALLVNVIGLDSNKTVVLRKRLREKAIHLLVVKNSLAKRAVEGTPLAAAFHGTEGQLAVFWGGEDIISLAKEVAKLAKSDAFPLFEARGGVMDGDHLTAARVKEISKWPNREQQLSILVGQFLSPGANLVSQLLAPGGAVASQIEKKSKETEV